MPLRISCHSCHVKLLVRESLINKQIQCPKCSAKILVESPKPATVEEAEMSSFGTADQQPFSDWPDFDQQVDSQAPVAHASNFPQSYNYNAPQPEPQKRATASVVPAAQSSVHLTIVKSLVIALPLAAIFLIVLALSATSLLSFLASTGLAFIVWLCGLGMAIYCYHCGEQGFSFFGKILSSAGVILIPIPLTILLHLTSTAENRSFVLNGLGETWTNMRYATESSSFQLSQSHVPALDNSAVAISPPKSQIGPIEILELHDVGSINQVAWSADSQQVYLLTVNGFASFKLWRYDRQAGLTCSVELPFECRIGKSQSSVVVVNSQNGEIYFLDPKNLEVLRTSSLRNSFGLISNPNSPVVLVCTQDGLWRMIDAVTYRQLGLVDADACPEDKWPSKDGRPYTLGQILARLEFSPDGQSLICVGGIIAIDGPKLTWTKAAPRDFWQIERGDAVELGGGKLQMEYLQREGYTAKLRYRNSTVTEESPTNTSRSDYQDLLLPGVTAPEYRIKSLSHDKTAVVVSVDGLGPVKQYLLFSQ
jgi:hypothetical protein